MPRRTKKARRITVEGIAYRWRASGNDGWISLTVCPAETAGPPISATFRYDETWIALEGGSAGDQIVVTNRLVRRVILLAVREHSYDPAKKGDALNLGDVHFRIDIGDAVRADPFRSIPRAPASSGGAAVSEPNPSRDPALPSPAPRAGDTTGREPMLPGARHDLEWLLSPEGVDGQHRPALEALPLPQWDRIDAWLLSERMIGAVKELRSLLDPLGLKEAVDIARSRTEWLKRRYPDKVGRVNPPDWPPGARNVWENDSGEEPNH